MLILLLGILVLALIAAYAARREIARQAVTGWLESRGVDAELSFERFDHDGLIGRLRAGPANNPDLIVERVEVDYGIGWWWSPGGLSLQPTRVRLVRPVVRARLADGKLSFGSLDPLIQDFLKRPPRPDARGPLVLVERGELRLATEAGAMRILGGARIDNGKLIRLDAVMPEVVMATGNVRAHFNGATLRARRTGDRLTLNGSANIRSLASPRIDLERSALRLDAELPYPDFEEKRGDGAVTLRATLASDRLGVGAAALGDLQLTAAFRGRSDGWIEDLRLIGAGDLALQASELNGEGLSATRLAARFGLGEVRIARVPDRVNWGVDGTAQVTAAAFRQGSTRISNPVLAFTTLHAGDAGQGVQADFRTTVAAAELEQGDLRLSGVRGQFTGARSSTSPQMTLAGGLHAAGGSWALLGAPEAGEEDSIGALKRALSAFRVSAPGLRLTFDDTMQITATSPVRLVPASGGVAVVTPRSGRPLFRSGSGPGGAFDLTLAGGALPRLKASVDEYALVDGGLRAEGALRGDFDLGFIRGARADVAGVLRTGGDGAALTASRCAAISAERLEFGENDVVAVSGRFCPAGEPLLRFNSQGWRASGRADGVDATVPFLQIAFDGADGRVQASGAGDGALTAQITDGQVRDTAEAPRFHPLRITGRAALAQGDWSGAFQLTDGGFRVADLELRHDGDAGAGGLLIDARGLEFREGGLQPAGLSPLAEGFVGTAVAGRADFTGEVSWNKSAAASSGRLSTAGLDFRSPLGQVTGLRTEVELTSLAPLTSAPGQSATAEEIAAYVPLTQAEVSFQLLPQSLAIESGAFAVAEGRAMLEPFAIPFEAGTTWEGAVRLEGVQLGEFIERSPFNQRVSLDAKVSGRLPFSVGPPGVRIAGGELAAIQPGRLSIRREALVDDGVVGGEAQAAAELESGVTAPVAGFNAQDFAYQALEHLAFDVLEAEVNSLAGGRLGVLLRIRGRHDPPTRQEIRLSWADVIARRFFDKPLPLPSDTGVNLTLDTTWNLDELLQSLRSVQAVRETLQDARSEPVQAQER